MRQFLSSVIASFKAIFLWQGWDAIAAIAAAVAAFMAWLAADAARVAPFQQTTYQSRHDALREYTTAQGKLHAVLMGNLVDLQIDDPSALTNAQIEAKARLARPTLDRYYDYTTAVNTSRDVWSGKDIDKAIETAGDTARVATECYKRLIVYSGDLSERALLNEACSQLDGKVDLFDSQSNSVIAMMRGELKTAWTTRPPKVGEE